MDHNNNLLPQHNTTTPSSTMHAGQLGRARQRRVYPPHNPRGRLACAGTHEAGRGIGRTSHVRWPRATYTTNRQYYFTTSSSFFITPAAYVSRQRLTFNFHAAPSTFLPVYIQYGRCTGMLCYTPAQRRLRSTQPSKLVGTLLPADFQVDGGDPVGS